MGALDLVLARERSGLLKRVALINTIWLAVHDGCGAALFLCCATSFLAAALLIFAAGLAEAAGIG